MFSGFGVREEAAEVDVCTLRGLCVDAVLVPSFSRARRASARTDVITLVTSVPPTRRRTNAPLHPRTCRQGGFKMDVIQM